MCRKCGEPDRRGSARDRRRSRARLLTEHGNGVICACVWCDALLSNTDRQRLVIGGRSIRIERLERDRLDPESGYAQWNLVPACGPCNRARAYDVQAFEDGCYFGASRRRRTAAA